MASLHKPLRLVLSALRAPWLLIKSQIGDASHIETEHPRLWTLMRVIGRFPRLRDLGLRWSHPVAKREEIGGETAFPGVNRDQLVAQLRTEGVAYGLELPSKVLEEIEAFARETPIMVNMQDDAIASLAEVESGAYRNGPVRHGEYLDPQDCAPIARLANDSTLFSIAADYLGVPSRLVGTRMWWSFPAERDAREESRAAQRFHFDLDDFKFVKFFFYLTDVDEQAGPHVCVTGTHVKRPLKHSLLIRRFKDQDVLKTYGEDRVRRICLPAGSGFAEDTFCLHKGEAPTGKPRLLLQFEFGINDFAFGYGHG